MRSVIDSSSSTRKALVRALELWCNEPPGKCPHSGSLCPTSPRLAFITGWYLERTSRYHQVAEFERLFPATFSFAFS